MDGPSIYCSAILSSLYVPAISLVKKFDDPPHPPNSRPSAWVGGTPLYSPFLAWDIPIYPSLLVFYKAEASPPLSPTPVYPLFGLRFCPSVLPQSLPKNVLAVCPYSVPSPREPPYKPVTGFGFAQLSWNVTTLSNVRVNVDFRPFKMMETPHPLRGPPPKKPSSYLILCP